MHAKPTKVSIIIAILISLPVRADSVGRVETQSRNSEESEITAAEAQIAETGGNYDHALTLSQKAVELDPYNITALDILIESAEKLNHDDILKNAKALRAKAIKKMSRIESASKQLIYAESDMKSEKWKLSSERLEYVTRTLKPSNEQDPGRDLFEEAQYRLGLAYLAQSKFARAMDTLTTTGTAYRQQGLVALGNYCFQNSYLMDALRLYTAAATQPPDKSDASLKRASLQAIKNLRSFAFDLRGGVSVSYDSNPFGYPGGTQSGDGTPNNNLATSVSLSGLLRSPISPDYPWYSSLFLSIGQYRSIEQGGRQQFDSESINTDVTLAGSRFPTGLVALRYGFQYAQSPIMENNAGTASYNYAASSRVQTLNLDLSKDFAPSISTGFNTHVYSSQFVTPEDAGDGNRTGSDWGSFLFASYRSESHLLFPSFKVGLDQDYANGGDYYARTYYSRVSDYVQFGKSGAETELSLEYDWSIFSKFSGGRSDFVFKPGAALIYPLMSHASLLAQISYSTARSTASYYNQDRFTGSAGLVFAL